MELSIDCKKRDDGANPRALRREGQIPAVLYGHDGDASVSLLVDQREAEKLVRQASVNNTLIQVNVPDISWNGKALLREVQTHPWKEKLYHLSFFSIGGQDSVEVVVPVHYTGDSKGVKEEGGTLDIIVSELAIRCAPDSIPENVEIDVSGLGVGDNLHISDLKLPGGAEVVTDTDKTLVSVAAPRTVASEGEPAEPRVFGAVPTVGEEAPAE